MRYDSDAILTKAQATEWAERLNNAQGTYYLSYGEYATPDYKAVRCRDGYKVRKTSYYLPGTIVNGRMLHSDHTNNYLSLEAWEREGRMWLNVETGSVDNYNGWWYYEQDADGAYTGHQVNAVDLGEVVEVVKNAAGEWVEA